MTNPQRKTTGLRSSLWLVEVPESKPDQERRRARPYYHRHHLRDQATWLDWLMAVAIASAVCAAITWAGAWPA